VQAKGTQMGIIGDHFNRFLTRFRQFLQKNDFFCQYYFDS
jgi:hypothetical protein